jgi:hypothetical protein
MHLQCDVGILKSFYSEISGECVLLHTDFEFLHSEYYQLSKPKNAQDMEIFHIFFDQP